MTADPISTPDVTVVVPARNEEPRIGAALASIGHDEGLTVEILVVDDGSTDGTAAAAEAVGDPRVRVLSTRDGMRGFGHARNVAFASARGSWIALLDADDAWAPGRLSVLLEAARRHGADLVADDVLIEFVDPSDDSTVPASTLLADRGLRVRGGTRLLDLEYFVRHDLGNIMPIVRRALIVDHGLEYRSHPAEDFAFEFKCIRVASKPILVGTPMYRYRKDAGRSTVSSSTRLFWMHVAQATAGLLDDHPDLPRRVVALLERRIRVASRRGRYISAKADLQRGHWGSALRKVLLGPSLLLVGLESITTRLRRRRWRVAPGAGP